MENLTIQQKLLKVQTELKAPKNQYNSFGKYNYRNQEDILEAVKPICAKYGINLIVTDDLVE
jgi:thiamine monophosphate synthase